MKPIVFSAQMRKSKSALFPIYHFTCYIPVLCILCTAFTLLLLGCGRPADTDTAPAKISPPQEETRSASTTDASDRSAKDNTAEDAERNHSINSNAAEDAERNHSINSNTAEDVERNHSDSTDISPVAQAPAADNGSAPASPLPAPSTAGALHVSGTQLVDSSDQPIQLRGISTHGLAWFPDYVNEECFSQLRYDWNINVIRLAMYTAESGGYCTDGDQAQLKELIRNGIRFAASQDLYVIVDWHVLSDQNPNQYLEEAKAFFGEISQEFAQETHILYEICNEPNGPTGWSDIKAYAQNIIPVIRANDPDAVILVGTPNWSQMVDQAAEDPLTEYDNIMYTLHFYAATHQDDLRKKMETALAQGLPIFVSEYGICDASGNGSLDLVQADIWVSLLDQYNISYIAWNLSNKAESSALLKDSCTKTSLFTSEDLSASGQWLYEMLKEAHPKTSATGTLDTAESSTSADSTPVSAEESAPSAPASDRAQEAISSKTDTTTAANDFSIDCGTFTVHVSMTNSWSSDGIPYYQYLLTLENTSDEACSQWAVDLPISAGLSLSDSWNGNFTLQKDMLHITSMEYNGAIAAQAAITDIGCIVSGGQLCP